VHLLGGCTRGLSTHRRASLYQSEGDGAGPSIRSKNHELICFHV